MADKRAYFKMDVGYLTNPKIAGLLAESPTAVILHIESIAYAAQHLTDGIVPKALVMRMVGAEESDAQLLIDAGVWIPTMAAGRIEVHDYLEHQRSATDAKALSDAGRKAAATRWQSDSDADGNADGNADRMRNPMPREREREKDKNTPSAGADEAFAAFWAAYPRKIGKAQAIKAWKAATKSAAPDVIMAGLAAHLPAWAATDPKFIPHATTWLNGERWTDEIGAPNGAGPKPLHALTSGEKFARGIPEGW